MEAESRTQSDSIPGLRATTILGAIRTTFADVIAELPGVISRPRDLERALEIDKQLAWRVFRLVHEMDEFTMITFLPGSNGVRLFLDAADKKGVSQDVIARASGAAEAFEEFVTRTAGDRATADLIIAAQNPRRDPRMELSLRKAAFRANCFYSGIRCRTQFKIDILNVSESNTHRIDITTVRGFIGLHRIRPQARCVLGGMNLIQDDGQADADFVREPLDRTDFGDSVNAVPLLAQFCSEPLPEVRRIVDETTNSLRDEVFGSIIDQRPLTCVIGEIARSVAPRYRNQASHRARWFCNPRVPCETLLYDLVVEEAMYGEFVPKLLVFNEMFGAPRPTDPSEPDLLPVFEQVETIPQSPAELIVPEIPRYREMISFAFDRIGRSSSAVKTFRVKMTHPPIPIGVALAHDLPDPP